MPRLRTGGANFPRAAPYYGHTPATGGEMRRPMRIWWARPRKLCALERPGGGGRSHRPERRAAELEYLAERGVRFVISTISTRHNLEAYDAVGLEWHHVPVASCAEGGDALE